jgi:hypothetical protein
MTMTVDCERDALLRELPSPWRKEPLAVPTFAIVGPNGVEVYYADAVLHATIPGQPPIEIPVTGLTYDALVRACQDAGIGAVLVDPAAGPLWAITLLNDSTRAAVNQTSAWNIATWNVSPWSTRTAVSFSRWTSDTWRLLDPLAAELAFEDGNVDDGLAQLNELTSAGVFADLWGSYLGIQRRTGESDADYTARMQWWLIRPRENNYALANLLEADFPPITISLVDDVVRHCFMPSDDIALRGRPLRGWYYNIATIEIDTQGGFPSSALVAAAEGNAACGVKVFVHGYYSLDSMPSPAGYDLAGTSSILFGQPLPIQINAPPPVGVGKIGPP